MGLIFEVNFIGLFNLNIAISFGDNSSLALKLELKYIFSTWYLLELVAFFKLVQFLNENELIFIERNL